MTSRCICQSPACYSINKILTWEPNIEHQTQGSKGCRLKPMCIHINPIMSLLRQMMCDIWKNMFRKLSFWLYKGHIALKWGICFSPCVHVFWKHLRMTYIVTIVTVEQLCTEKKSRQMCGGFLPSHSRRGEIPFSLCWHLFHVLTSVLQVQFTNNSAPLKNGYNTAAKVVFSECIMQWFSLHLISNSLQLIVFQSPHSPVSAFGITFHVSVKSLLPGTIKEGLGHLNPVCQNSNGPSRAVSFICVQSIAGSSVPPLIINCEGGEGGRKAGLLFPLLKEDCQQNNSPQLKSQYISWSLLYVGAQLLSKELDEKETEEVQTHRDAYGANIGYLLDFSWLLSCLVLCQSSLLVFLCAEKVCL